MYEHRPVRSCTGFTVLNLRIRTLIAEAGRELRTATETIKMEKGLLNTQIFTCVSEP